MRNRHLLRRGSSAIEFALMAPVLVMMVMGILQFSWRLHQAELGYQALMVGARAASEVNTNSADVEARAIAVTEHFLIDYEVCTTTCAVSATAFYDSAFQYCGVLIEADPVTKNLFSAIPFLPAISPSIHLETTIRVEVEPSGASCP